MARIPLRDVFWLTLIVGMACAWLVGALTLLIGIVTGAINGLGREGGHAIPGTTAASAVGGASLLVALTSDFVARNRCPDTFGHLQEGLAGVF